MASSSTSSWVPGVHPTTDFSLSNLPLGIITTGNDRNRRPAVAIGDDYVIDLSKLVEFPHFDDFFPGPRGLLQSLYQTSLDDFVALGREIHSDFRKWLRAILSEPPETEAHAAFFRDSTELRPFALVPRDEVIMHMPVTIGDYTDFYAGIHHAQKVGELFRGKDTALQPNYRHLPVGYHGRASSIVVSGTSIQRPRGQILLDPSIPTPTVGPSRKLDFELELGCIISKPNEMGEAVDVDQADSHIFGYVLLNDWSARDIQAWEYVPLGPFNGKNFATSISPWVVLADALEECRTQAVDSDVEVQEYLKEGREDRVFDIQLEVDLTTPEGDTTTITRTSSKHLMWSFPQMIAHHTLGGCPLRSSDLLGSGTISGPSSGERGSLLEMSEGGKQDVMLHGMDVRRFLKDGDTLTIRGHAGEDGKRVGFGSCTGRIYDTVEKRS